MRKNYIYYFVLLFIFAMMSGVGCAKQKTSDKNICPEQTEENMVQIFQEEPSFEEPKEIHDNAEVPESPQDDVTVQEEPKHTETDNISNNIQQKPEPKPTPNPQLPYYIKVNRLANCVTIYKYDENGAYTIPIKAMICSVGNPITKTPTGIFKTSNKYTWRYLYGDQYGQYATRINGPILFHSVPYKEQSNDSLKTEYYNNLGVEDSMGCIRLTCEDAKWIYDNCPKGTTVEIYESIEAGPLGKPSAISIDLNSSFAGWDPTDPHPNNPWRSEKPTISGVIDITTPCGVAVDLLSHVSATDWLGNNVSITLSGEVNFNIVGEYEVIYSATDSVGNISQIAAKVMVNEVIIPPDNEMDSTIEDEKPKEGMENEDEKSNI